LGGAVTVRELAVLAGVRRDSVGRVLRSLERAGWVWRERGDGRRGIGDTWSATALDLHNESLRPYSSAKMKAASKPTVRDGVHATCCAVGQAGNPPRRLAKGELQELVLEILRDKAPESVGVVALARMAGGRSQGAVADACERLVGLGMAVMVYKNARQYMAVDHNA
jgi:hypothetical protein